ncbi:MAG TPA: calcium-binding protein [Polyangium sp.]|nr:calcium-binding protein [Polyangium sp.]
MNKIQHWSAIGSFVIASAIIGGPAEADDMGGAIGVDLGLGELATINGTTGDDVLNGTAENDVLNGGDGMDTLNSLSDASTDELYGGAGMDNLVSGGGPTKMDGGADLADIATYTSSPSGVQVNLASGQGSGGYAQGDTLVNIECVRGSNFNDNIVGDGGVNAIFGGSGDDLLIGGGNIDILQGEAGNDLILGSEGADRLSGGDGNDTFRCGLSSESTSTAMDTISDFGFGADKLSLWFMTVNKVKNYGTLATLDNAQLGTSDPNKLGPNEVGYAVDSGATFIRCGADANFRLKLDGYTGGLTTTHFVQ